VRHKWVNFFRRGERADSRLAIAIGVGTDSAPTEAVYQVFDKLRNRSRPG